MSRRRAQKASARGQRGGGRELVVSPAQVAQAQGQTLNVDGEWFGPGRPLSPVAPRDVAGRRFDFQFGSNINVTPRQTEEFSFGALRTLADRHDLTRLAIETCKDRMVRLNWGFRVLDSDDDMTDEQKARAGRYRTMLRRPDGKLFWVDWLRQLLEDMLVIDAASVYVRRTVDETEVVGLCQIDGATVKPVIDAHGNEPEPPQTAYQQVLHGMPAVNYTSAQLIYAPRNRRVQKVYGFSPVEQIIATINIALRRQLWQHSYFTDGNIPDSLIGVPSTWTPDQIRDFQDWFDAMLTGNTQRRRGGVFVPGEVAKSYVPTKEAEMFGAGEEWFARVVCFCFGIPHQALVKEVNRATADNAYEQAIEDGLAPVMTWVKSLMDRILIDVLGETEIEFWWLTDKPIDPKVQDEIWKGRVDAGMADRNEWRVATGMKPREEKESTLLLYQGKPLGVEDQIDQQKTRNESGVFPTAVGGENRAEEVGDDEDESSGGVVASGGKDGGEEEASSSSTRKHAEGENGRPFVKEGAGETASELGEPDEEHQTLTDEQRAAFRLLSPERPVAERARRRLQRVLQRALRRQGTRVAAAVRAYVESLSSASKADEPDAPPIVPGQGSYVLTDLGLAQWESGIVSVAIESLGSWDFVIDGVSEALETVAADATRQAVAVIGSDTVAELTDVVSARSVAAAEERAAELVGRRVLADGTIIDNPSARWAISDSTRTMIRERIQEVIRENEGSDALIQSLQDDHAFSPARAEMISRTEIADINSRAHMETYHAAQEAGVTVKKAWLLGPRPCQICRDNHAQGAIPLEESFKSGDTATPAHPHCVCVVVPEVE